MAISKKRNTYVDMDLDWLELRAEELKLYCELNPISTLSDRMSGTRVVQTIEGQIKCIRDTLQDYIKIIEAIDKLREKEDAKKSMIRGDAELSPLERKNI